MVLVVKNLPDNGGDIKNVGSIPGSGRCPGGGHGNPLQYSCLENPMARGAWWATVHRVAKSRTLLKWLSTHAEHWVEFSELYSRYSLVITFIHINSVNSVNMSVPISPLTPLPASLLGIHTLKVWLWLLLWEYITGQQRLQGGLFWGYCDNLNESWWWLGWER